MHQFGYEVEEEKVFGDFKLGSLWSNRNQGVLYFSQDITAGNYKVTRKELEEAGFGWIFSL